MYKVYGFPSSRMLRVTWTLEELKQAYDIINTFPRTPEAIAVNPSGKVPVLEADGTRIADSVAICSFLTDRHPQAGLNFPPGTPERAMLDSWLQFAMCDVEAPLWLNYRQTVILPDDQRTPAIVPLCKADWQKAMDAMAQRLGDRPFVMGKNFTLPDIFFAHIGRWAAGSRWPFHHASLDAYFGRVTKRPAFARALVRERKLQ